MDDSGEARSCTFTIESDGTIQEFEGIAADYFEPYRGRYEWYARVKDRTDNLSKKKKIKDKNGYWVKIGDRDLWGRTRLRGIGKVPESREFTLTDK